MNKTRDFASELDLISTAVERDVGTIMKLVQEEQAAKIVQPAKANRPQTPILAEIQAAEPSFDSRAAATTAEVRSSRSRRKRERVVSAEGTVLDNVTTRIHRETNELLTEAALRQRLKKLTPATRQDIIEAALRDWLRRHDYWS